MSSVEGIGQLRIPAKGGIKAYRRTLARRFLRNRAGVAGLLVALVFASAGIFAPSLRLQDPYSQDLLQVTAPPSWAHWFGTDGFGRDVFSRVVHGARYSLAVGLFATSVGMSFGGTAGVIAGFYGGRADDLVMRTVEILMAFPGLLLALLVVGILGPGLYNLMLAVGISASPSFARVVRASILSTKAEDFVEAARAIGATGSRVLLRHVVPNSLGPIVVQATLLMATSILTAASLSFLGLGPRPPIPEWGIMLSEARNYLYIAPHTTLFPGLAILMVALGFNLAGDALRDALDIRVKVE